MGADRHRNRFCAALRLKAKGSRAQEPLRAFRCCHLHLYLAIRSLGYATRLTEARDRSVQLERVEGARLSPLADGNE